MRLLTAALLLLFLGERVGLAVRSIRDEEPGAWFHYLCGALAVLALAGMGRG